jgi:hypothetical protein
VCGIGGDGSGERWRRPAGNGEASGRSGGGVRLKERSSNRVEVAMAMVTRGNRSYIGLYVLAASLSFESKSYVWL